MFNYMCGVLVEDIVVILICFESGVMVLVMLMDVVFFFWSFEGVSGENFIIVEIGIFFWWIGCMVGSFEFLGLRIWCDV